MKLWQIPLEPAYPMAYQAVSEPPATSPITPKWQEFVPSNKYRDIQFNKPTYNCKSELTVMSSNAGPVQRHTAITAMRDSPSMVQKLLEEEREAVKSALQAVDHHMQLKKKEVEEVHRKLLKDEPMKDHIRAALQMDLRSNRHRLPSTYTPLYNPPIKQKPIFLEAISEEDNDQLALPVCGGQSQKRTERIRHSAMSRNSTVQPRYSYKEKLSSAKPRVSEVSVLPPIDIPWSSAPPKDGVYKGPVTHRWQWVADNYIDSDLRVRSRRRCRGRAQETKLRLGYQDDEETEDEFCGLVEREMRLPRKRQINFGPPYSTSYSRWLSHFTSMDGGVD